MSAGREAETAAPGIVLVGLRRSHRHHLVAPRYHEFANNSVSERNSRGTRTGYRHQHSPRARHPRESGCGTAGAGPNPINQTIALGS